MKTKMNKWIIFLFLASMIGIAYVTPANAQYLADEFTVGLWHLDKEFGTALTFDGIDDYVEVTHSPSLDNIDKVTIEAWVYAKGTGTMLKIACKRETQVPFYFIGVDNGKLYAGIGDEATYVVTNKVTDLPLNEWHHVAMAYSDDEDKIWLYLDGELKETVTCTIDLVIFTANLLIGAQFYNGQYTQFFDGVIDEVRISNIARASFDLSKPLNVDDYTVALWHFDDTPDTTASDSSGYDNHGTLHNFTSGWVDTTLAPDTSSNNNFGTVYGATWTTDSRFGPYALDFDGSDDYVEVPDDPTLDITDSITLEAWVKADDIQTGKAAGIITKDDLYSGGRSYNLHLSSASSPTPWALRMRLLTLSNDGIIDGTTDLRDNTWHHVAGTWDGSIMNLYVDGILQNSRSSTGSISITSTPVIIGDFGSSLYGQYGFDGIIDEVRIYNRALSSCEIAALMPTVEVDIDIKPGSYPNSINLGSKGVIPVAILSSESFDATTVDPGTVTLGGSDVAVRGKGSKLMAHEEDVNGDGYVDLVLQVETENLNPNSFQDGDIILLGITYDCFDIQGMDEATFVPYDQ